MNRKVIALILSVILVSGVGVATVVNNNKNPTTGEANDEVEKNIRILEENEEDITNSKDGDFLEIEKNHSFEKSDIDKVEENTNNENILERIAEEDTEKKLDEIKNESNEVNESYEDEDPMPSINNSQVPSNTESPKEEKPTIENNTDKVEDNVSDPYQSNDSVKEEEGIYLAEVEAIIFNKVNEERANAGIEKLEDSSTVKHYAREKSSDMATKKYFSHEGVSGELVSDLMKADGFEFTAWGENIAFISGSKDSSALAEEFMKNWMNSKGHRENILSGNFSNIGVGVYKLGNFIYATQEFYR